MRFINLCNEKAKQGKGLAIANMHLSTATVTTIVEVYNRMPLHVRQSFDKLEPRRAVRAIMEAAVGQPERN